MNTVQNGKVSQEERMKVLHQLILGSSEIDRMEKEIIQVVSMIIGLVKKEAEKHREISLSTEHRQGIIWDFVKNTNYIYVERWCTNKYPHGNKVVFMYSLELFFGKRIENKFHDKIKNIQSIYESLPDFIDLMITNFPDLKKEMQPFLDASKVQ